MHAISAPREMLCKNWSDVWHSKGYFSLTCIENVFERVNYLQYNTTTETCCRKCSIWTFFIAGNSGVAAEEGYWDGFMKRLTIGYSSQLIDQGLLTATDVCERHLESVWGVITGMRARLTFQVSERKDSRRCICGSNMWHFPAKM